MRQPDSNLEWQAWGKIDPIYGVNTNDTTRGNAENTYEQGRVDWASFLAHWEKYGLDRHSCVEIGCGAGRITLQLAGTFQSVTAIDVSPGMIEFAQRNVTAPNVAFVLANGQRLPLDDASVSAAFSTHVFQHFDSPRHGFAYFEEIARVLRPGGSLMIHLPMHRWPQLSALAGVFDGAYALQKRVGHARAWMKRRLMQLGVSRPVMRYMSYSVDDLFELLPKLGLSDVETSTFRPTPENMPHSFVLARRG